MWFWPDPSIKVPKKSFGRKYFWSNFCQNLYNYFLVFLFFFKCSMAFRLQNSKVHLTYKGHLDLPLLLAHLNKLVPMGFKYHSLVHENGQEDLNQFVIQELGSPLTSGNNAEANLPVQSAEILTTPRPAAMDTETVQSAVQYAHTHVLLEANKKIATKKANFFDFEGVHPNVKLVLSVTHFLNCWKYHSKAPIKLLQSLRKPVLCTDDFAAFRSAKSLSEACKIAGITVRSVADINLIRKDIEEVDHKPLPLTNKTDWLYDFPDGSVVYITGASGIGKTRWVMDNFENALFVSHMEDLKRLKADHDCIVFDDMLFKGIYTLEQCIQLCDVSFPRTISVKYGSVTIPAGMRRIFTSNREFEDCFPEDTFGALRRRVTIFRCAGKLFQDVTYQNRVDPLETLRAPGISEHVVEMATDTETLPDDGSQFSF